MTATTWVQIIKAGLLMTGATILSVLVGLKSGMNPFQFFNDIATSPNVIEHVQKVVLNHPIAEQGFDYGQRFLEPGLYLKNPLDQISLGRNNFV